MRPFNRASLSTVLIAVILAVVPLLAAPPPARAAGFTVNSTADEPDAVPGDGACVSTPSGACTLRAAVMETNTLPGADTISVPAGTYELSRMELPPPANGSNEDTGAFGDLDILDSVTIVGSSSQGVIVRLGGGLIFDRVFDIVASSAEVTVAGLTVMGGNASGDGGGLNNRSASLRLESMGLIHNISSTRGGGLANGGVATLVDVLIVGNAASTAGQTSGGGIANSGTLTGSRVVIEGNSAGSGARFGNAGAGVYTASGASSRLVDSVVRRGNGLAGAGIYNDTNGTVSLERVEVSENVATQPYEGRPPGLGGGIYNLGRLDATNVTVSGNRADRPSAGLHNGSSGQARLSYLTFSGNESPDLGTSILNAGGTAEVRGSILFHAAGGNCAGTITSSGFNVDSGDTCDFGGATERENVNPLLGPLAENGGFGRTHALLTGSPAIDIGLDPGCPAQDQRGQLRFRDGDGNGTVGCDAGAFEVQGSVSQVTCTPRPPVRLAVVRGEPGALRATVEVTSAPGGAPNTLRALRFGTIANALVEAAGQAGIAAGQVVPLPAGTTQTTLTLRRGSSGDSATVRFAVLDECGEWTTFVGGGPDAWGTPASPPSAPTPAAAAHAPALPTAQLPVQSPPRPVVPTTVPAAACTPRPPVTVQVAPDGSGRLRAVIRAGRGGIRELRIGQAQNGAVDAAGRTGLASDATLALPDRPAELTVTVRQLQPDTPVTVPLVVVDECGEWPTVVGAGRDAGL